MAETEVLTPVRLAAVPVLYDDPWTNETLSIQVPGGVGPIILQRDAVSGDGYAMTDMDTVAQSAPGAKTRFVAVDFEGALAAHAERNRPLQSLREALA